MNHYSLLVDFLYDGGDCCLPITIPHHLYVRAKIFPSSELEEKKGPIRCLAVDEKDTLGNYLDFKVRPTILGTIFKELMDICLSCLTMFKMDHCGRRS